jgi:hypothetical protein
MTAGSTPPDIRVAYGDALEILAKQAHMVSSRDLKAARRLPAEVPASALPAEVVRCAMQFMRESAVAEGAWWPDITDRQAFEMGSHWNLCPNVSLVPAGRGSSLVLRSRPDGHDPDSCIFDMGCLERFAPGKEPPLNPISYDNWREHVDELPFILTQDFDMVEEVQRGMKSAAWKGARLNPVKEQQILNNHRVIEGYVRSHERTSER